MSLTIGQAAADPVTGIAGRLYNLRVFGNVGGSGTPRSYIAQSGGVVVPAARAILADECLTMATWVHDVLTTQMTAVAEISTSASALQQHDPGGGAVDTLPPSAPRTLPVTVT